MTIPYLGQIGLFAGTSPAGWARCDGTHLRIDDHQALHAVIGRAYGGDGDTTFALPKLDDLGHARYLMATAGLFPQRAEPDGAARWGLTHEPPMTGSIMLFGGNYTVEGWLPCDGRLMQLSHHTALFVLVGKRYGGDGSRSFGLPTLPDHGGARYLIAIDGHFPNRH